MIRACHLVRGAGSWRSTCSADVLCATTDSFHKPGFKMHTKILHHLFRIASEDAIKAPLWDTAALGPTAFPNNAAYLNQQVSQLLTTSFSNLRPQQVEVGPLA